MSGSSKVLVLGAGGMLGSHVVRVFEAAGYERDRVIACKERFLTSVDVRRYLNLSAATTVVNCIGYTGGDAAEHFRTNGCLPRTIADWCSEAGVLHLHVSTNAVFPPHETRRWRPDDALGPRTVYEVAKAFGEDPRAYVLRASFIGESPKRIGLFHRLRSAEAFRDRKWNGVTALALAQRIVATVAKHDGACVGRIVHVYSSGVVSVSELASLLGSPSVSEGTSHDTRLLGGGEELPPIAEQLAAYREYLNEQ